VKEKDKTHPITQTWAEGAGAHKSHELGTRRNKTDEPENDTEGKRRRRYKQ